MFRAWRASSELWMHAGSWESTREAFEWHEAKPSASLASRVLSQLPKCIHNSTDAQLKHGTFLLEHCHFKRKLIKHRIQLNHSERFDWLNVITRFDRRTGVRLSRFRCTLAPYKKRAKNCELCSNIIVTYVRITRQCEVKNFHLHGLIIFLDKKYNKINTY